jgi:hypothetical protein
LTKTALTYKEIKSKKSNDANLLSIELVAPNKILVGTPVNIVIRGSGFEMGTKLDFGVGSINIPYGITSSSEISVLIPASMPALTYNLSITNPDGEVKILNNALTIQVKPVEILSLDDLKITDIIVTSLTFNSAKIEWETNIPTNSKLFLSGGDFSMKTYDSISGYALKHYVDILGLKIQDDLTYLLEVEVIASNGLRFKQKNKSRIFNILSRSYNEILDSIIVRIGLNTGLACDNLSFNKEEVLVCEYYRSTINSATNHSSKKDSDVTCAPYSACP